MAHIAKVIGRMGRVVLDTLLPPTCLACDTPVMEPGQFCVACFSKINLISSSCCRYCGVPLEQGSPWGTRLACDRCLEHQPLWCEARAALRYDGHSKRVILALKHSDRPELAHGLGAIMARAGSDLLGDAELLVPVPLHPSRLRVRRYNQSGLLARVVSRISAVPLLLDGLVRTKATPSLGELSAEQRARAVEGVFAIRRGRSARLAGRRIVLIDDVLTSGATARGCTEALLAAGASRVDLLVAARVPDPRRR